MPHRPSRSAGRLRFDSGLMSQITRPAPARRRLKPALLLLAGIGVVALAAFGVSRVAQLSSRHAKAGPVVAAAKTVLTALASDELEGVVPVMADGEPGITRLREEDEKIYKAPRAAANTEKLLAANMELLRGVQAELLQRNVTLGQIEPLAFGGIEAAILDPETMRDAATTVMGSIYFAAGDAVFALEVTMRVCKAGAFITDFWKCGPVDATPDTLKQHAAAQFRAFRDEPIKPTDHVTVKHPRQIFVPLKADKK